MTIWTTQHNTKSLLMLRIRTLCPIPDLFRTIFGTMVRIRTKSGIPDLIGPTVWENGNKLKFKVHQLSNHAIFQARLHESLPTSTFIRFCWALWKFYSETYRSNIVIWIHNSPKGTFMLQLKWHLAISISIQPSTAHKARITASPENRENSQEMP